MTSYVGLDVSLAETSVCVLDERGAVRFEGRVPSLPEPLVRCLREHAGDAQRVGLETGQTAGVLFRALTAAGLPALSLETRHAHRVLSARPNKTDRNDARGLAELMRVGWYRAAWVRGVSASHAATLAHELTHWTKHDKRLARDFGRQRHGDEGYAREELVAELGAAFLCADLGITPEVREDHAAYIASWLTVLKGDKRFIFTAAGHAQRAADYLHGLQPRQADTEAEQERAAA